MSKRKRLGQRSGQRDVVEKIPSCSHLPPTLPRLFTRRPPPSCRSRASQTCSIPRRQALSDPACPRLCLTPRLTTTAAGRLLFVYAHIHTTAGRCPSPPEVTQGLQSLVSRHLSQTSFASLVAIAWLLDCTLICSTPNSSDQTPTPRSVHLHAQIATQHVVRPWRTMGPRSLRARAKPWGPCHGERL